MESRKNITSLILKLWGLLGFLIGENLSLNLNKSNIFNNLSKRRVILINRSDLVHPQGLRGTLR